MEFQVQSSGLPVGIYDVEFIGAEPYEEHAEQYGAAASLKFRVTTGEHSGTEISRICSAKMTAKTRLGKFAAAIKGDKIQPGERFNFGDYVGVTGKIVVQEVDGGATRIETFMKS